MEEEAPDVEGSALLGLHRSREGREVLRGLSSTLAAKLGGQANLAAALVDPKSPADFSEVERLRKALFRKDRKLQQELSRDPRENIPLHARLERSLMAYIDFRALLEDHMTASRRRDVILGLTSFFGGGDEAALKAGIEASRGDLCRLFSTLVIQEGDEPRWSIGTQDRTHYFHYVPDEPYLVAHEFQFQERTHFLGRRRSGYAFPLAGGLIHRLMVNHENPTERTHDFIFRATRQEIEALGSGRPGGDVFWNVQRSILSARPKLDTREYNGRTYHVRNRMMLVSPTFDSKSDNIINTLLKKMVEEIII